MITQKEFYLKSRTRGFHLVTDEIARHLQELPQTGMVNLLLMKMPPRTSEPTWQQFLIT